MPEREGAPQEPPLVRAVNETKKFAEDIENNPAFKEIKNQVVSKLGEGDKTKLDEAATNLVKNGVAQALGHIGLLPAFSNPEAKQQILDQLKNDKQEGSWIEIMSNWNVGSDPFGVSLLEQCKHADIGDFIEKAGKDAESPEQKEQIKTQADAMAKGQDLIISHYKSQVHSGQMPMAA